MDKNLGSFDLYDAFIMSLYHFKTSEPILLYVDDPSEYQRIEAFTCNSCKENTHPMERHEFFTTEGLNEDPKYYNCVCATCKIKKEEDVSIV